MQETLGVIFYQRGIGGQMWLDGPIKTTKKLEQPYISVLPGPGNVRLSEWGQDQCIEHWLQPMTNGALAGES